MEIKELKITKIDMPETSNELGWQVDIVAHLRLGYFAGLGNKTATEITKILIEDVSKYLKNHYDITKISKSGK